jgi:hypothetical protein
MTDTTDPQADRAAILAEAIARVEDPEERAKTATGLGLGWESARDVLRRMAAEVQQPETQADAVHACPPDGSGITPCCGRTPFELPRTDRMSADPTLVTCQPAAVSQPGKEA